MEEDGVGAAVEVEEEEAPGAQHGGAGGDNEQPQTDLDIAGLYDDVNLEEDDNDDGVALPTDDNW